jgi:hypothetical protein
MGAAELTLKLLPPKLSSEGRLLTIGIDLGNRTRSTDFSTAYLAGLSTSASRETLLRSYGDLVRGLLPASAIVDAHIKQILTGENLVVETEQAKETP